MQSWKFIEGSPPRLLDADVLALNLRHLQVFAEVAQAGGVARAAEALFRVPSAVTRAVKELEASLGVPLFERQARGMLPNAYGKAAAQRTARIAQEFADAARSLSGGAQPREPGAGALLHALFSARRLALVAGLAQMHHMPSVARAFGVTQPALSALLRELEAHTGRALFTRSAQGTRPTPAGELLAFHCRRALAELRALRSDLAAIRGVVQGHVVVGALPLSRTLLLPAAISALLRAHPGVHVSTVESPYHDLAAALRGGDVDLILGALRTADAVPDLMQETLFEDRIALVARAGHPLARRRGIGFDDLRDARWILSRRDSPSRGLFERAFRRAGRPIPAPAVETGDLAVLRGLLLASDMLTAISAHQLHYEIAAGTLAVLDFPLETTRRQIGIATRQGALASPCTQALIGEIRRSAELLPRY